MSNDSGRLGLGRAAALHQPAEDVVGGVAGVLVGRLGRSALLRLLLLRLLGGVEGVGLVDELFGELLGGLMLGFLLEFVPELLRSPLSREILGGLGIVIDRLLLGLRSYSSSL